MSGTTFLRGENPLRADKLNTAFSERVLRRGDTMQGMLTLWRDPSNPFDAATKQYVDRRLGNIPPGSLDGGGTLNGPLYWTATGSNTMRSAQDRSADVANALDFGADPTGVVDSSAAINSALAFRRGGRPSDVFLPSGTYLLDSVPLLLGDPYYSQRLFGNGWSTILLVTPRFSASAPGVIIFQPSPYNDQMAQASVCHLRIAFQQPPDFSTTTTAIVQPGVTTVPVASVSGIRVGSYCVNLTNPGSLTGQVTMPKVANIAGNVLTLDRPTVGYGMALGDTLVFSGNRSQAVTLSPVPSLAPGSPAIKYPWAIYAIAQSVFFDHVVVSGAWNGIYIRGQSFVIGQYFVGCLNIGLDIDQCYNFPKIDHFMLWGWGINYAMSGIYYDGQTIAANIGQCDDFTCDVLQSWCGAINLTASFSWGTINQLKLDGDNSRIDILGGSGGWLQVGQMYKTGGQSHIGTPLSCRGTLMVSISYLIMFAAQPSSSITLSGGKLTISGGLLWNGQNATVPMIDMTGGALSIDQMQFDASTGRTDTYLRQTGGSVRVSNSVFVSPAGAGGVAFALIDTELNSITNVALNFWSFNPPGDRGRYEVQAGNYLAHYNGPTTFVNSDNTTQGTVTLMPRAGNAKRSKLRFFGSFPTTGDIIPRLAGSISGTYNTLSWNTAALKFNITMQDNNANDDANMIEAFSMVSTGGINGSDTATTSTLGINGSSGSARLLRYYTASSPRFDIIMQGADAAGNTGADIWFRTYDNSGNFLGNPVSLVRSTGVVTFSQPIVNGSDRSLKTNIEPVTNALAIISQLSGVYYKHRDSNRRQVGLIAQDVLKPLPEVVFDLGPELDEHGEQRSGANMFGIAYPNIVAVLIEAIKELDAKVIEGQAT